MAAPSALRLSVEHRANDECARQEWEALAEASRNVFATHEWLTTWWRHFGRERPLRLLGVRDGSGKLVALFPLYLWSGRPRVLRFLGHGTGARMGPICAPDDARRAGAGLRQALELFPWDVFVAEGLPGEQRWPRALGYRSVLRSPSPRLTLSGSTWPELLAGRSANFRSQIGRKERRLARGHGLRYRLVEKRADLPGALDVLFALHRARWTRSPFIDSEPFHRDFAVLAIERGWLRLWLLELDGRPIAAWYGFRFAGVESYYQAGRDPSFAAASPGFVLLAHSIREAAADGMLEYRLGPGGSAYKYRFGADDPGTDTIAITQGAVGRAALGAVVLGRRVAPLRRFLRHGLCLG